MSCFFSESRESLSSSKDLICSSFSFSLDSFSFRILFNLAISSSFSLITSLLSFFSIAFLRSLISSVASAYLLLKSVAFLSASSFLSFSVSNAFVTFASSDLFPLFVSERSLYFFSSFSYFVSCFFIFSLCSDKGIISSSEPVVSNCSFLAGTFLGIGAPLGIAVFFLTLTSPSSFFDIISANSSEENDLTISCKEVPLIMITR